MRWHAASRGVQAVRDYDNARKTAGGNSSPESDAAWQRVLYAASDLVAYPKDSRPGSPSDLMTRLGLADANPRAHLLARSARGALLLRRERLRNCALLIALRKISELERVGVVRLVAVGSPWLDHTAAAALTGARPEELRAAQIRKNSHGALEIRIAGAKVSDTKG